MMDDIDRYNSIYQNQGESLLIAGKQINTEKYRYQKLPMNLNNKQKRARRKNVTYVTLFVTHVGVKYVEKSEYEKEIEQWKQIDHIMCMLIPEAIAKKIICISSFHKELLEFYKCEKENNNSGDIVCANISPPTPTQLRLSQARRNGEDVNKIRDELWDISKIFNNSTFSLPVLSGNNVRLIHNTQLNKFSPSNDDSMYESFGIEFCKQLMQNPSKNYNSHPIIDDKCYESTLIIPPAFRKKVSSI